MAILVITVDLQCCRCKKKIKRVLECLQEDYCIEKIEYEDKSDKVIVRGQFDAEKLRKKIWCKACKVVKEIIIVTVWPPPPPPKPCPPEPPKPCPPEPPKPKQPPPPPKLVPYPYPVPYPMQCQSSPWNCLPQQCDCCPKPPPSPPPRPPSPPKPKPCECSQSHHHAHGSCDCGCGGKPTPPPPCNCSNHGGCGSSNKPPIWQPPNWPHHPPPWCEEIPSDACSIM